ncbi:phosphoesterase RecJ-like protein [Symbiobacterium terraclitae]|uniref:Phosphoesterase RecJ-like protein n=1 Tax=Symbiobacterium terraclitae TaxID=557451 RepID=A0ABS4JQ60_9FIRM|nr:phosphoesterase RecJ-like protein [Symbiobacterium terraclitae]
MSSLLIDLAAASRMIRDAQRILFFMHVQPDGDSIGSTLGMIRALRQMGKEAVMVGVDPIPPMYHFLPGWDSYRVEWQDVDGEWDLSCFLDCGDLERVGDALPAVQRGRRTLNVDHHATNTAFAEFNYLDFSAAAVGELAYRILREIGAPIDPETALCLYTSLVTDTGGFRYDSTGPSTHRVAADLIELGARPYDVAQAIFETESLPRLALLARALQTLRLDGGGRVAWMVITREMLREAGAQEHDAEGVVNYARSVSGVEVGILFKETPDGRVRVSLRSRKTADVGAVAKGFGGGGHARAAGCTLYTGLDEAVGQVLAAVKAVL